VIAIRQVGWLVAGSLLVCVPLPAAVDDQKQSLDRRYQSAVSQYDSGRFAEAAAELESLLPYAQTAFEVHELLGMAYASQAQTDKAETQLKLAVQLKPDSAMARTNLGTCLFHGGKLALAAEQFRAALKFEPENYEANHNLGALDIQTGNVAEARPLLERAHQIDPASYDNGYDLAMADFLLGRTVDARQTIQQILKIQNTGELHNLMGKIEEKEGRFVQAATEFELAAHMEPSEDNLFDWGCELLLHRTYEPAIAVFRDSVQRYPESARLLIGLGLTLYARGKYDEAVQALLKAADRNPSDPRCYLFLSKAYDSSPNQAEEVIRSFRRFAELQPGNALAHYYLAMSLWKGKRAADAQVDLQSIESLLRKSIALDASLPQAHVQLGNLYADQHRYDESIPEYVRALALDPTLSDAHYRLGTDYVHTGQKERAQKEFDIYQKLRSEHLAEIDKERAEVQQFVYSTKVDGSKQQ
jgi:tetratricopeptide (TPR) repeat protein